jgi:polygalacturonase
MLRFGLLALTAAVAAQADEFDVRHYGARGDGQTLDSPAINRAIAAANAAGGGTVVVPVGVFNCGSIHLLSHVYLQLDPGSRLHASASGADFDRPEPNPAEDAGQFEDWGHRHWHNSLIWAEGAADFGIIGTGLIEGKSLERDWHKGDATGVTVGNKAIAFKNCHNVLLRDFSILYGGWFGILAIGTDNLTIEALRIDTNRDGMDIDCCRNVHVTDCSVNSPLDDGICLKSTHGLGYNRATENVTISDCHVSGFDTGTFLDGTYQRHQKAPTGRIKFGTESNGGYKNVTVTNCTFDYCCGLALEEVDGGVLEDVTISNLVMRDIVNSPIYIRLSARNRGPKGTQTGIVRRVSISHIQASNVQGKESVIIAGVPGHNIEDISLSDIHIFSKGGGTQEDAAITPPELVTDYPEPSRHGVQPAYGYYVRHVRGISFFDVDSRTATPDARPAFVLDDVSGVWFDHTEGKQVIVNGADQPRP